MNSLIKFIGETRKSDQFLIIDYNNIHSTDDVLTVSKKDLTLFGSIKSEVKETLHDLISDVVIYYSKKIDVFDYTILSNIASSFKAGVFSNESIDCFDLTLKTKSDEIVKIYADFEKYLKKLNINK